MKCPVCSVELKIAERQGVEIDYCPQCRGVWLDRGELDKIIERSNATGYAERDGEMRESRVEPDRRREPEKRRDDEEREDREERYERKKSYPGQKRKKRSFLEDIFDF